MRKRLSKLKGKTSRSERVHKFPNHNWNAINLREEVIKMRDLNSEFKRGNEEAEREREQLKQGTEVPPVLIYLVLLAIMFALAYSLR